MIINFCTSSISTLMIKELIKFLPAVKENSIKTILIRTAGEKSGEEIKSLDNTIIASALNKLQQFIDNNILEMKQTNTVDKKLAYSFKVKKEVIEYYSIVNKLLTELDRLNFKVYSTAPQEDHIKIDLLGVLNQAKSLEELTQSVDKWLKIISQSDMKLIVLERIENCLNDIRPSKISSKQGEMKIELDRIGVGNKKAKVEETLFLLHNEIIKEQHYVLPHYYESYIPRQEQKYFENNKAVVICKQQGCGEPSELLGNITMQMSSDYLLYFLNV